MVCVLQVVVHRHPGKPGQERRAGAQGRSSGQEAEAEPMEEQSVLSYSTCFLRWHHPQWAGLSLPQEPLIEKMSHRHSQWPNCWREFIN